MSEQFPELANDKEPDLLDPSVAAEEVRRLEAEKDLLLSVLGEERAMADPRLQFLAGKLAVMREIALTHQDRQLEIELANERLLNELDALFGEQGELPGDTLQ